MRAFFWAQPGSGLTFGHDLSLGHFQWRLTQY
jgi:hypothetical protein